MRQRPVAGVALKHEGHRHSIVNRFSLVRHFFSQPAEACPRGSVPQSLAGYLAKAASCSAAVVCAVRWGAMTSGLIVTKVSTCLNTDTGQRSNSMPNGRSEMATRRT